MSDLVPIPKRGAHDSPHLSRDIPSAFVPIEQLLPYARNARTHSDAQVAQIAASIVEWGWTNPILADAKGIVAGHGRLAAARLLYGQGRVLHLPSGEDVPAGCVPCIDVSGWSDTARRAYVLADNQLALQAGWDDAMLAEELRSIRDDGFDISLAGFDAIPELEPVADIEDAPVDDGNRNELREKWAVEPGQLWQLGAHRLLVGDCTIAANVDLVLGGDPCDTCFTSPPYALGQSAKVSGNAAMSKRGNAYDEHDDTRADWPALMHGFCDAVMHRVIVCAINVQMLANNKRHLLRWSAHYADRLIDQLVWNKSHGAPQMQPGIVTNTHELLFLFGATNSSRKLPLADWHGTVSSVVDIGPQRSNDFASDHGATMPIELPIWFLSVLCNLASSVIDPFAGTGTTLMACEKLGRRCYAIEMSPAYGAIILERWHRATGLVRMSVS